MKPKQAPETVFIVDDRVEDLHLLSRMLTKNGYKVRVAKNGKEALESIQSKIPELILLDVKLPDINGFELCILLKKDERTNSVPVIFLSGLTETVDKLKGFNVGGIDYITKPFINDEVTVRVKTHLEMSSLRLKLENIAKDLKLKNKMLEDEVAEREHAAKKLAESFAELERSKEEAISLLDSLKLEMSLRQKNEIALLQSEERFQTLSQNIKFCFHSIDIECNILDVNQQWLDTFGFERENVIGKWFGDFLAPEYLESFNDRFSKLKAKGQIRCDCEMRHKNGTNLFVTIEGKVETDLNGNFKQTYCTLQDVAESKQVNEVLRKNREDFKELFDNAPIGYHEIDSRGQIIRVNETELNLLGYTLNEFIGQYFWMFDTDESNSKLLISSKLAGKLVSEESYERNFRKKNGAILSVLMTDKILKSIDGEIIGIRSTVQDVTERKRLEQILRESEEQLKFAFGGTNDGVWDVNMQTNSVYLSQRGCEILGYLPEQLDEIISKWNELVHPDDMEKTNAALQAYLENRTPIFTVEQRLKMASGEWKWILTRGKVVSYNSANEPLRMVGTHTDVSETKLAEQALKESEAKFRTTFMTSPDCVNINRLVDGRYLALNQGFTNILGYSEEDILGKTSIEKNIWLHLSDRKKWAKELNETGKVRNFIAQFQTKSGKVIYGMVSSTLIELEGVKHVLSLTRDITELKKAEEEIQRISKHYQAIIEKSPDGCVLIDHGGCFKYASPSALRMFGYDQAELMLLNPDEVTHPDDLTMVLDNLGRLIQDATYVPILEYRFKHKNGEWIWIQSTFPNLLSDSNVESIVINFRDITERKNIELKLLESEANLSEAVRIAKLFNWKYDVENDNFIFNDVFYEFYHTTMEKEGGYLMSSDNYAQRFVHPDEKYVVGAELRVAIQSEDPDYYSNLDHRIVCADGQIKHISVSVHIKKDSQGKTVEVYGVNQDITERKQADENLRFSEQKFRTMFENSIVGKSITTIEGKLAVNKAFTEIVGYSEEELSTMHWSEFTHEEDVDYNIKEHESILDGKKAYSKWEKRYIHKDGHIVWVHISTVLLRDIKGLPIHFITEIYDITDRKMVENALRESESKFRSIAEQTADLIAITNSAGIITYASNASKTLFLVEPEDMCGHNFVEFLDKESIPNAMESFKNSLENQSKVINLELLMRRSDGSLFYGELNGSIYNKQRENETLVVIHDITERKLAEKELLANRDVLNKLLFASTEFIDSKYNSINYKKISDNILELSGAKYVSFNIFDEDGLDFTTVAISGIDGLQEKINSIFGCELMNKKWKHDPVISNKLKDKISTRFDSFFELTGFVLSRNVSSLIERTFNIGEAWVVRIAENNKTVGDFTLLFTKNSVIKNPEIVELYATQVGLFIERLKSEEALRKSEEIYRNLVQRIPDGVYKSTPKGEFLDVNPAMIKMLGYNSREELLNINIISELYFDKSVRDDIIANNSDSAIDVFQLRKKDGSGIRIEDHAWYNTDEHGNIISHEGVLRDFTQRKKAEIALQEKMDELMRFHNLTVDRELTMIELKNEVNDLCAKLGLENKYSIVE